MKRKSLRGHFYLMTKDALKNVIHSVCVDHGVSIRDIFEVMHIKGSKQYQVVYRGTLPEEVLYRIYDSIQHWGETR
jgi:hypothetical protein